MNTQMSKPSKDAPGDDLVAGCSHFSPAHGPTPARDQINACAVPTKPPEDLLAFLRAGSFRNLANEIGISRSQLHRLASGYWPPDPRQILAAWHAYKAQTSQPATSWFLRRVGPGGVVRHGRACYSSPRLVARAGELIAVARAVQGCLLAVALDPPDERFALTLLKEQA